MRVTIFSTGGKFYLFLNLVTRSYSSCLFLRTLGTLKAVNTEANKGCHCHSY